MIAARHRFHGYNSLKQVYKVGSTYRGPQFSIKVANNQKRRSYRVAVVVSKKVSKSAVTRNRIRRRIYEVVRGFEPRITGPYDIVISVFNEQPLTDDSKVLKEQLLRQLRQAKVIE